MLDGVARRPASAVPGRLRHWVAVLATLLSPFYAWGAELEPGERRGTDSSLEGAGLRPSPHPPAAWLPDSLPAQASAGADAADAAADPAGPPFPAGVAAAAPDLPRPAAPTARPRAFLLAARSAHATGVPPPLLR